MTAAAAIGASRRRVVSNLTAGGVTLPNGWALQRLDTFGTANSVPGPLRLHGFYYEAATWDRDSYGAVFIPNSVINNQQQTYQHFEDSTFNFMSDRLRIQGRGQVNNSIKSGQLMSRFSSRSFIWEARFTAPSTLGTWVEFWAYNNGSSSGDTSELDVELPISEDGSFLTPHTVSLGNIGSFAPPVIDDSHVVYNAGGLGLTIYTNAAFNSSTGPHYYTIYYDDTGSGEVRRYIDGVLMYHAVGKWNNSLGGTGFGPDAALLLDLATGSGATGGQFPGTIPSPSTWSGDLDIYSVGFYTPGSAGYVYPTASAAWDFNHKAASIALSGNDLVATAGSTVAAMVYTIDPLYTGKYYWEILLSGTHPSVGLGAFNSTVDVNAGAPPAGLGWWGATGQILWANTVVATWATYGYPVRLCFAIFLDPANSIAKWWGRVGTAGNWNNDVIGNQNPATNTGGYDLHAHGSMASCIYPAGNPQTTGDVVTLVASAGSWAGTPPSGFGQMGPT